VGSVLAAGLYSFIMFVEYDTQRGMMRWCESEQEEAEVESGRRSVRSHDFPRSESEGGAREASVTKEAGHETVSRL
jgi:hypothetical protein